MERWTDAELIEVYEAMFRSQTEGTLNTLEESLRFMAICSLLGERGYRLTQDEHTWVKKDRSASGE